ELGAWSLVLCRLVAALSGIWLNRLQFILCQRPPMAERKIAQAETSDSDADEFLHFVADFVKHPANLAIDSLAQSHAQPRGLDGMDFLETRALAVQRDAVE